MDLGTSEIRQRKGITKIVEDFDIFEKVVENVKEEKKASSGAISFVCFTIIFCLFCTETYTFLFHKKYDYRFAVDTEMDEMPLLDLDMVINTPCNIMQVASSSDEYSGENGLLRQTIQKNPTRFDFTDEEQMYWTILRHAHDQYNKRGLRALEELEYVDDDIETNLEHLANEKQEEEAAHIKEQRMKNKKQQHRGNGQIMFLVSNGMGMFQLVADNGGGDGDDGKACRLHGKFRVRKGKEEKIIMSISNPLIMFDHGGPQQGNISHRIEKFNFGPRIPGLVTPLAGAEHISESGQDIYRYFIKIVPTKIYGYFTYTLAYQYSVTFLKKQLKEGEHSHGGILFEYEFTANVIEVHKTSTTLFSYLIRICSILGGVYATSTIINNIVQFLLSMVYTDKDQFHHLRDSRASLSTDSSHSAFVMDANMQVH
ncbi:unnamed protein product [Caenorhabditis nigoni]|uniref:Endoplasmic reticulum vesicle transporter C-terminal domain-containing protein n=1 Tax=Caenorhabditis nigoni TaxID=1611254 RepID=A0A2G5T0T9_9PELO|nr:hypothetical protein B9Z55_025881 [Caenorhabditis nigoni]